MRPGVDAFTRIVWSAGLGMATGALASLAAIGFVDLVLLLNEWLLISPRSRFMEEDARLLLLATVCVPAAGGLVVGLVHRYLIPERRPHGPPDVIRSVQELDGRIPPRSGFLSALTSLVSLGAGASVGQYGPLAHLGATLGSLVARVNPHSRWMATVGVGCGVAAAISTAFNAPLAGIVFAHEVILRHYSLRAFAPITVAATIGLRGRQCRVRAPAAVPRRDHRPRAPRRSSSASSSSGYAAPWSPCSTCAPSSCPPGIARRKVPLAGLPQADAGRARILGARRHLDPRHPRHRQGDAEVRGHRPRLRIPESSLLLLVAKILATALCIGFGFAGGVFSPALLIGVLFGALAGNGAEAGVRRTAFGDSGLCRSAAWSP